MNICFWMYWSINWRPAKFSHIINLITVFFSFWMSFLELYCKHFCTNNYLLIYWDENMNKVNTLFVFAHNGNGLLRMENYVFENGSFFLYSFFALWRKFEQKVNAVKSKISKRVIKRNDCVIWIRHFSCKIVILTGSNRRTRLIARCDPGYFDLCNNFARDNKSWIVKNCTNYGTIKKTVGLTSLDVIFYSQIKKKKFWIISRLVIFFFFFNLAIHHQFFVLLSAASSCFYRKLRKKISQNRNINTTIKKIKLITIKDKRKRR